MCVFVVVVLRYKAESQCQCQWFFKETSIVETTTTRIVEEKTESYFECRLEMTDPTQDAAGMYKCIVRNDQGEINANLTLNIQVAPEDAAAAAAASTTTTTRKTSSTTLTSTTVRRKKYVSSSGHPTI